MDKERVNRSDDESSNNYCSELKNSFTNDHRDEYRKKYREDYRKNFKEDSVDDHRGNKRDYYIKDSIKKDGWKTKSYKKDEKSPSNQRVEIERGSFSKEFNNERNIAVKNELKRKSRCNTDKREGKKNFKNQHRRHLNSDHKSDCISNSTRIESTERRKSAKIKDEKYLKEKRKLFEKRTKHRSSISRSNSSSNNRYNLSDNHSIVSSNNQKLLTKRKLSRSISNSSNSSYSSSNSYSSNRSSSSASTLLSKHRSRSRSIVKNSRNRKHSLSSESKYKSSRSNKKSTSSKLTDKKNKVKDINLKDSKDKSIKDYKMQTQGSDWDDEDCKFESEFKSRINPNFPIRPCSKERQEQKNKRLENSNYYSRSEDVIDGSSKKFKTNFNANKPYYNYYDDNAGTRNVKRERLDYDDNDYYSKRTLNEDRFYKDRKSDKRSYNLNSCSSNRDEYKSDSLRKDTQKEMEAKLERMQAQGLWREMERSKDVEMYIESNEKEDREVERNLKRCLRG